MNSLLKAIKDYWQVHGYAPSVRNLMEPTGLQSSSAVYYHLVRLRQKGLVEFEPEVARSIRLTPKAEPLLAIPQGKVKKEAGSVSPG